MQVYTKYKIFNTNPSRAGQKYLSFWLLVLMTWVIPMFCGNQIVAQVELDAVSSEMGISGTTITVSHTTGSEDNRLMMVGITTMNVAVNSVTYGGTSLDFVGSQLNGTSARQYVYSLVNPSSGTANVVVTFSGSVTSGATVGVTTFSGVSQSNPLNAYTSASGNNASPSLSDIPSGPFDYIYSVLSSRDRNITDGGAGQTLLWNLTTGSSTNRGAGSIKLSDGALSSVEYSVLNGRQYAISGIAVKPIRNSDLSIDISASNMSPALGSNIVMTLTAQNLGDDNNTDVIVEDVLPIGLNYVSHTVSSGSYNSGTGIWNIGNLDVGNSATLQITVEVDCDNVYNHSATISGFFPDFNLGNNASFISVQPVSSVPNRIELCAGETFDLTQLVPCFIPSGNIVNWHSGSLASDDNKIAAPTNAGNGFYYAAFEDTAGSCFSPTAEFEVVVIDELNLEDSVVNVGCFGSNSGAIFLNLTGGSGLGFSYLWSDGSTSQNRTNLVGGFYSVLVTDLGGCNDTVSRSFFITQIPQLSAGAFVSPITCFGENDGFINLSISGGQAPFSISWTGPNGFNSSNEDVFNLSPGTYTLNLTDDNSCNIVRNYNIIEPSVLGASAAVFQPVCGTAGSITIAVSGGTAPFTFNWQDLPGTSNPRNRSNLSFGTYSLTITDARGCTYSDTFILNDPNCPPAIYVCNYNTEDVFSTPSDPFVTDYTWSVPTGAVIVSGQGTPSIVVDWSNAITGLGEVCVYSGNICGESVNYCQAVVVSQVIASASADLACVGDDLQLFGGGGAQYQWFGSNSFTSALQTPILFDVTPSNSGTYTVVVSNEGGCTDTATVSVTIHPAVLVSTVSNPSSCGLSEGSIDVTVDAGTSPYFFSWSNGASTQNIANLSAGNYILTVTDDNGCTNISSTSVSDDNGPELSLNTTQISCYGEIDGAIDLEILSGVSPYLISWSTGATTEDISGLEAGIYSVLVTDAFGCASSANSEVDQPNILQLDVSYNNVSCFGGNTGSINASVTGGTPGYTYVWSTVTGSGLTPGIPNQSGLTAGVYLVEVTDDNGCSDFAYITIEEPSLLTLDASSLNVSCFGGNNGAINLDVAGGEIPYVYSWSNGASTKNIYNLTANSYTVDITDRNGCTTSLTRNITQPGEFTLSTDVTHVDCYGNNSGAIDLTLSGGNGPFQYEWSNNALTQDVTGLVAGTYSVTVTDANFCVTQTSAEVTQPDVLSLSAIRTNVSCFGFSDGAIDLVVSGGAGSYSYVWTTSNGSGLIPTDQDQTGLTNGTYSVLVSDISGCTAILQTTLTQPNVLSVSNLVTDARCPGGDDGEITLSVTGGTLPYSFNWSGSLPSLQNQQNLEAGNYSVVVTDANSCSFNESFVVSDPPAINISATTTRVSCHGTPDGAIDMTVSGGVAPYGYLWSNGFVLQDPQNILSGYYSVIITDLNSCNYYDTFYVDQPDPIVVDAIVIPNCPGQSNGAIIYVETEGGNPPYIDYYWSDIGSGSPNRENLAGGTYDVTVTDTRGCQDATFFTLLELDVDLFSVDRNCLFPNGQVFSNPSDGTGPYSYEWTGPGGFSATSKDIANLDIGIYTVTVTDARDCFLTLQEEVSVPSCIPPVAVNDSFFVIINTPLSGSVEPNDSDGDHLNSELIFYPITFIEASQGTLEFSNDFDGSFTYTPAVDFVGVVTIIYQVCDPTDLCDFGVLYIEVGFDAGWTLTKTSITEPNIFDRPGDTLHFEILVENTGETEIGNVVISDPRAIAPPVYQNGDVNSNGILDIGEVWSYTAMCITEQSDVDFGAFVNTAFAFGTLPIGNMPSTQAQGEVPADQRPAVRIRMTNTPVRYEDLGEVITFRMVVTNMGNVTLTSNNVEDSLLSIIADLGVMSPGSSDTIETYHVVTQEDLDNGYFIKMAHVQGIFFRQASFPLSVYDTTSLFVMRRGFIPLPVELILFNAEKTNDEKALLTWVTAAEVNNDYFEVQHSTDGIFFTVIGYVQGKGTTSEMSFYNFVHHSPLFGTNYYKLKQVDFDGQSEYSDIRTLIFNSSGFDISLLASITTNPFIRVVSQDTTYANIRMFTADGRELFKNRVKIDKGIFDYYVRAEELASALYFITYEDDLGNKQSFKYFKD